ncbi:hypothetical protein ABZZ36_40985 [Actinacidiphila glaucinigra]|uniref:hypothetical protein n=1 Tax=Actinacidiphila glaucinigra TaxID=235986 RepID=UPI0033A8468C
MNFERLSAENSKAFTARFGQFEDGVITGIRLHVPRGSAAGRTVSFDIQAVDMATDNEWRLVHITIGGVHDYRFVCSEQQSYFVLSDGLKLDCAPERCVLDLDPGPDEWSPEQVHSQHEYSEQYAIGLWCDYAVSDGPFI